MITKSLRIFYTFITQCSIVTCIQSLGFVIAAISCCLLLFAAINLLFPCLLLSAL